MNEPAFTNPIERDAQASLAQVSALAPRLIVATLPWGRGLTYCDPSSTTTGGQWERARGKIQGLSVLERDWDGYGAAPMGKAAVAHTLQAIDILSILPIPAPEISPTSRGTISLVWEFGRTEACIEIGNSRYSGYIKIASQAPAFVEGVAGALDSQVFWPIAFSVFDPCARAPTITNIRLH
jgi:hypothetical protein